VLFGEKQNDMEKKLILEADNYLEAKKAEWAGCQGYECPHCQAFNNVEIFGCGKIRCGFYINEKNTDSQIELHWTDEKVTSLKLSYGCGKIMKLPKTANVQQMKLAQKRKPIMEPKKTKDPKKKRQEKKEKNVGKSCVGSDQKH
jgi:hypothetical protein